MGSISILTFGDVFRYKEEDYIYLASSGEVFYTAKILGHQATYDVKKMLEKRGHLSNNSLFFFVILTTSEVKDRMANFGKTDGNDPSAVYQSAYCKLEPEDLKSIRDALVDEKTPVPLKLKELLRDLEIK